MKKGIVVACFILLMLTTACSGKSITTQTSTAANQPSIDSAIPTSTTTKNKDAAEMPLSSKDIIGTQYDLVLSALQEAGLSDIETIVLDDLTSSNELYDGAVSKIEINGKADFEKGDEFPFDSKAVVTYHIIRRLSLPVFDAEIKTTMASELRQRLEEAGFVNISTSEIYDLEPGSIDGDFENEMTISGVSSFSSKDQFPFDAEIVLVTHFPYETYPVSVHIDFIPNLIFSKYDVDVYLDSEKQTTLPHGEDGDLLFDLRAGSYELVFCNSEDKSVKGTAAFEVENEITAEYKISCTKDKVDVETVYFEQKGDLSDDEVRLQNSESAFIGEDYKNVVSILSDLGFTDIKEEPLYDIVWGITKEGSVKTVTIDGKTDYRRGDVVNKGSEVVVLYHMPYDADPAKQTTAAATTTAGTTTAATTTTEIETVSSVYEYAFVKKGKEYSIYYVFDTDTHIVKNFSTDETSIWVGTFSGDFDSGLIEMAWEDGDLKWTEAFRISGGNAVLIDNDGFTDPYSAVSVEEAERIMNQEGYHESNTVTPPSEVSDLPLSITDDDITALISYDRSQDEDKIRYFAEKHRGKEISLSLILMEVHSINSHYSDLVLISAEEHGIAGPMFLFEGVSGRELHLVGENVPDTINIGTTLVVKAEIEGYDGRFILLKPISTEISD